MRLTDKRKSKYILPIYSQNKVISDGISLGNLLMCKLSGVGLIVLISINYYKALNIWHAPVSYNNI